MTNGTLPPTPNGIVWPPPQKALAMRLLNFGAAGSNAAGLFFLCCSRMTLSMGFVALALVLQVAAAATTSAIAVGPMQHEQYPKPK